MSHDKVDDSKKCVHIECTVTYGYTATHGTRFHTSFLLFTLVQRVWGLLFLSLSRIVQKTNTKIEYDLFYFLAKMAAVSYMCNSPTLPNMHYARTQLFAIVFACRERTVVESNRPHAHAWMRLRKALSCVSAVLISWASRGRGQHSHYDPNSLPSDLSPKGGHARFIVGGVRMIGCVRMVSRDAHNVEA